MNEKSGFKDVKIEPNLVSKHTRCLVWFLCCNGTLRFVCCPEGISIRYELFGWIGQGTSIKDLSTHSSYSKSKSRHGGAGSE